MHRKITINGHSLTIEDVVAVARFFAPVEIDPNAFEGVERARRLVLRILDEERSVYGVSTGFGEFSKVSIGMDKSALLQENLILSHCVAVGQPLPAEVVRAMMLLRANALLIGNSGIRRELIEALVAMLNENVVPVVPEQGSLGASGDLAPLSHIALVLIGRGEAYYQNERMDGAAAMSKANIPTYHLVAKEGLALINGTQCMTALAALAWYDLARGAALADICCSLTMEALTSLTSACDPELHTLRPHKGQAATARNLLRLMANSPTTEASRNLRVQDAYAIRCVPQVHGAVVDAINYAKGVITTELNSVTDNPIILPERGDVISGGNFHGEPIAIVCDFLKIAASELASISERRLERMVNPALSCGLPAFLTPNGGVNSGFMICQYSSASIVSENKVLAHPASVDSIPSSANQEDHVSMGTTAARQLRSIVDNLYSVLAFELMAACQGIDLRGSEISPVHRAIYNIVRERVAFHEHDVELRLDVEQMGLLVRDERITNKAKEILPELEYLTISQS